MSQSTQSKLYFLAAALFLIAVVLSFINDGVEVKTVAGLIMAGVMVSLGLKAHKAAKGSSAS